MRSQRCLGEGVDAPHEAFEHGGGGGGLGGVTSTLMLQAGKACLTVATAMSTKEQHVLRALQGGAAHAVRGMDMGMAWRMPWARRTEGTSVATSRHDTTLSAMSAVLVPYPHTLLGARRG
jgi:hypothetical protein